MCQRKNGGDKIRSGGKREAGEGCGAKTTAAETEKIRCQSLAKRRRTVGAKI